MGKLHTSIRISESRDKKNRKLSDDWYALYLDAKKQRDVVSKAGEGSRRANTAEKKLTSIRKKMEQIEKKKEKVILKEYMDRDLVESYGESAMEARSFGTDRGIDRSVKRRTGQKEPPIRRTHEVDRKKGKAKGGYVKKYAKGGGVRKVRS